jgi:hypothetical protein
MLRREDGGHIESRGTPVDRRGEYVMTPRRTEGHDTPGRVLARALQNPLQLADLVAAVHLIREVVALDP